MNAGRRALIAAGILMGDAAMPRTRWQHPVWHGVAKRGNRRGRARWNYNR